MSINSPSYFGKPARCGATVLLKLLPLLASQFVDQAIAPRSDGYLATGMYVPQLTPLVKQSSAALTTVADT